MSAYVNLLGKWFFFSLSLSLCLYPYLSKDRAHIMLQQTTAAVNRIVLGLINVDSPNNFARWCCCKCQDYNQNRRLVYRAWRVADWARNITNDLQYESWRGSVRIHTPGIYLIYSQVCLQSHNVPANERQRYFQLSPFALMLGDYCCVRATSIDGLLPNLTKWNLSLSLSLSLYAASAILVEETFQSTRRRRRLWCVYVFMCDCRVVWFSCTPSMRKDAATRWCATKRRWHAVWPDGGWTTATTCCSPSAESSRRRRCFPTTVCGCRTTPAATRPTPAATCSCPQRPPTSPPPTSGASSNWPTFLDNDSFRTNSVTAGGAEILIRCCCFIA